MDTSKQPGGVIVRGDDGTIYFIRDEVLKLTKVTEPEMAEFCTQLLSQKSSTTAPVSPAEPAPEKDFEVTQGAAVNALAFTGPFQAADADLDAGRVASSTVMCPGTMGLADFEVLPVFRDQQ